MAKISVLIADDSPFMRSVIRDIINADSRFQVVGEATNGEEALEMVSKLTPDLMTLDLEMPKKNGITVLRELAKSNFKVKIIIVSAYTTENTEITLDCLNLGAVDFLLKPSAEDSINLDQFGKLLISKSVTAVNATPHPSGFHQPSSSTDFHRNYSGSHPGVIVIGSSTGGPVALEKLILGLEENFSVPVVIAQHLPDKFTHTLVQRLQHYSGLSIVLATDNLPLEPGVIYFIPGGHDGTITHDSNGNSRILVVPNTEEILTPSVDKLFLSASHVYRQNTIGIILTGMGNDGLLGAREIKADGGQIVVQDKESSAIYGMGHEVAKADLADFILPLDKIGEKLHDLTDHG